MKDVLTRFSERYVPEPNTGCWLWTAAMSSDGYGALRVRGKQTKTSRVSYELYRGKIPKGLFVLHKCDTPACVNPDHLFLGTQRDNMHDRRNKGRGNLPKGSKHHAAKFTEEDILRIRQLYATGEFTQQGIADLYSTTNQTINKIILMKRWGHI